MTKFILRQAQDDGLKMPNNKIMVRLRRELSRTLVEPLILEFDIYLLAEGREFRVKTKNSELIQM
jgi:hypothetical protein